MLAIHVAMRSFNLTEIQSSVAQSYILKINFIRRSDIMFPFHIVVLRFTFLIGLLTVPRFSPL